MRAIIQRVQNGKVLVGDEVVAEINKGLVILLGIHKEDRDEDISFLVRKIPDLRVFEDSEGKMNLSSREIDAGFLVVSEFTLYGDCRKGRRPSYTECAKPEEAKKMFDHFVEGLKRETQNDIQTGIFQEKMEVQIANDGPVTLILDSKSST